jgi:NAD(P)-dependent dehydrogenase (short-subunit alcohol dehydrogenase family)
MHTMDLFSLKGKVAVITGGERMYGKSCSVALTEAGAKLYMACPFLDAAEETASELWAAGARVEVVQFYQDNADSIRNLVEHVVEKEGRIDVFLNACRVIPKGGDGWFQEEQGLDWSVKVNSAGMLYVTSLVGKQMIAQKSGSIISFASMMGLVGVEKHNYDGEPGMDAGAHAHDYALNKSGIIAWTRHAASYYGRYGVRVNSVCPGGLQSDRTPPKFTENYSKHTQLGRLADSDDIKGLILFLASDASAYITGLSIPVDGGYTCI